MGDNRRRQIIDFVEKEFIGPDPIDLPGFRQANGEEILITDSPRTRYIAGILYPMDTIETDREIDSDSVHPIQVLEGDIDVSPLTEDMPAYHRHSDEYEEEEELINRSNAYNQSAISLTVGVKDGDKIKVDVSAARYVTEKITDGKTDKKSVRYLRNPVFWNNDTKYILLPNISERICKVKVGSTDLQFDVTYRYKLGDIVVYTFTLENTKVKSGESISDSDCYFQAKFSLISEKGFSALTDSNRITKDEDYLTNQLLYRDIKNYAIGHGCSADWEDKEIVDRISTAVFPKYEVKPIVPNEIENVSLKMLDFSPYGDFDKALVGLATMCDKYLQWINSLKEEKKNLSKDLQITAERHIKNCIECHKRMVNGIKLLKSNKTVKIAFQYMNLAMLMQQLHFNLPLRRWICDENDNLVLEEDFKIPSVTDDKTWYGDKNRYGKWRPFQLAFVLMNLKSMMDKNCKERELIDLIWFPTGGGKTEAYLALSAYTIFIRRMTNMSDSGTAILMRYTLRLLTAQQYERASAMICACEKIRSEHEDLFGKCTISIGLWVGSSTTPNNIKDAVKTYESLKKGESENPFVILKCPWCGAQMGPVKRNSDTWSLQGYIKTVGPKRKNGFAYRCSNKSCDYSKINLPMYIIDEDIYQNTPTLLLGTVDKFAMLPYKPIAASLFGYDNGTKKTNPDLIIQDELHLISGPLGSMVGHYETLIQELCKFDTDSGVILPKIIASTATISRAKQQCHALYGCAESDVFQFPPSGLNAGDSFFAKEDKSKNGRIYVGIMALSSSVATASIRLSASLLYSAKAMKVTNEDERDPYWTNIGYYNSIRELGQAATWVRADIDQHLDVMYKRRQFEKQFPTQEEYRNSRRYIWRDEELTSRISGSEVSESLSNLGIKYTGNVGQKSSHPIDICLASNMISVGLDVPRLGLMSVAGQPKTTSEYIQATSRVGRDFNNAPGLVFVLYNPARPRDKSHYEHFKNYHSKMYCNVEPTSVTPFSTQVRERALHAIMIGMMRLENNDKFNSNPPKVPDESYINKVFDVISDRVKIVDQEEYDDTTRNMKAIIDDWSNWNPQKWEAVKNYEDSYSEEVPLMYAAGSRPNDSWEGRGLETPTSMRNVDSECEARVLANRYEAEEN